MAKKKTAVKKKPAAKQSPGLMERVADAAKTVMGNMTARRKKRRAKIAAVVGKVTGSTATKKKPAKKKTAKKKTAKKK